MHSPILAPSASLMDTLAHTADVGIVCGTCLDTLTPDAKCQNVGACIAADVHASRNARGATVRAWTISGNVD